MKEDDKKMKDAGKAKEIMSKIDPELLSAALGELIVEADEAEEPDVERVKKSLKEIYDSIPEGKDKASIMSKAIGELDADVVGREVKVVKEKLANIDRETLIDAAKDFVDVQAICHLYRICFRCLNYIIPCLHGCIKYLIGCSPGCIKYLIFPCTPSRCIKYSIFVCPNGCIKYPIIDCQGGCPLYKIYECRSIGMPDFPEWEIDPVIKEKLKAEIIQELLQSPEINRAMKKMLTKIKEEG